MSNDSSIPPISSPHGAGNIPLADKVTSASGEVSVSYTAISFWGSIRMTAKAMVVTPICVIFELIVLPIIPLIFLVAVVINFLILLPRGLATTALNVEGLHEKANYLSFSIRWQRILWILDWGGDVCFCTFGGGCFVPREAFNSREEAHEFATIARALKSDRAWRDEWNGRIFGPHPADSN